MLTMQRAGHGMQMEEDVVGCYGMLSIHHNGRKSILCILNLEVIQES